MHQYLPITDVYAREILDSRGNPTLEVEVLSGESYIGKAAVPSGASTGQYEAWELRDGGNRYHGKGVQKAVDNINEELVQDVVGEDVFAQETIDKIMIEKDGTENKERIGANAILGLSLATARSAAKAAHMPLYCYLGQGEGKVMPVPMMNILNGGCHAKNSIDFQEFMIMPVGAKSFEEALRMGTEVYHTLKEILAKEGKSTAVGDEGGFAPDLKDTFEVFEYLMRAVTQAGYQTGKDIVFAMDAAASELYQEDAGMYYFPGESQMLQENREEWAKEPDTIRHGVIRPTKEMIELYVKLCETYPIVSIEDALDEEDWEGWKILTETLGKDVQLVGDDLFVTNSRRLQQGIEKGCANSILIKLNQIGSLTETLQAIKLAHQNNYTTIISHRSGETEDTFIADLAVAVNAGQIKTGAPCRGERVAKYNRLLKIEQELGENAVYYGTQMRK